MRIPVYVDKNLVNADDVLFRMSSGSPESIIGLSGVAIGGLSI